MSTAFYCDVLGFQTTFAAPKEDPFFAIVRRDGAQIMVKAILPDIHPLPNCKRHPWARWDALVLTPDPDMLNSEFARRGVRFHSPLADTDERLRGFEIEDHDGYVLFFGRPIDTAWRRRRRESQPRSPRSAGEG